MANVFLSSTPRDIETAVMLEQAYQHDIGNAVAYTDGNRIFINTDDNLYNILPAYNHKMLKWLLWHERFHKELRHHNRFFKYLKELDEKELRGEFALSKAEVNIIMDILVHDSLERLFPELVETAVNNLAQMRNRNSLGYTFKTYTLEEMLDEYKKYREDDKGGDGEGEEGDEGDTADDKKEGKGKGEPTTDSKGDKDGKKSDDKTKAHGEGGSSEDTPSGKGKDKSPKMDETAKKPETTRPDEHDKTDWKKLEKIDTKEFIDEREGDRYIDQINRLKQRKFRLGKLTETLNGLATTTKKRSYAMPSTIHIDKDIMLKGRKPGKAALYLCFDASGSMGSELETFKDIISKSIPQAMDVPCEWFTSKYGKGKFRDIMPIRATNGFSDDGDRTIELCYNAEQKGYSPIGVTDGGGCISWSTKMLKQLKRTVLVGQNREWLEKAKKINPNIQILDI